MLEPRHSWSTQQLVDFLAVVSTQKGPEAARRIAIECAAEALEADVGAIVDGEALVAVTGFGLTEPSSALVELAQAPRGTLRLPWGDHALCIAAPLGDESGSRMVVGRVGDDGFSPEETGLLRGMAQILTHALRSLALLDAQRTLAASLDERGRLLERLSRIQRAIIHRGALQDVLDAIVEGARDFLGDEVVGLRLLDRDDPTMMEVVASAGISPDVLARIRRTPSGQGVGGRAIAENRLVLVEDYQRSAARLDAFEGGWLRAAVAAPVHENGEAIGSLVVASTCPGRVYTDAEQGVLALFAEHASLAVTDARNVRDALREARHDSLTGLANRRAFLDAVRRATARDRRSGSRSGVLLLDVDNFKSINDGLGHEAGDAVLRAVAARLQDCIREGDLAARLGGDEFAVLVDGSGEAGARQAARRILQAFDTPVSVLGRRLNAAVSIGVSSDPGTPESLLRQADLAMYAAKGAGKGRFTTYTPALQRAADQRRALELDLRRALDEQALFLQYQPIVRLADESIVGAEALLRWRHPERGLIPPCDFIPLAEESGLIVPIGRWVLEQATRQAAGWTQRWPDLGMGVNISALQVSHPDFAGDLSAALDGSGLRPRNLILELTETVLMNEIASTIDRLWHAKRLGVQIAVDDFGTGYSSLQYLDQFPLDILKLPRAFVQRLEADNSGSTIARAVVELGHNLGLHVVGEGIERLDQLVELRGLGCALGQGFYFARPLDADAFEALLDSTETALAS